MPDIFLGEFSIDTDPPTINTRFPANGSTDVAPSTNVSFNIIDFGGAGVDTATLNVTFNGIPVILSGVFENGYVGTLTAIADGYAVLINPNVNFPFSSLMVVTVTAADLNPLPNVMPPEVWAFNMADSPDIVPPQVVNNSPVGPHRPLNAHILLDIVDPTELPLLPGSVVIRVQGVIVFQGELQQGGYTVTATPIANGVRYDILAPFDWLPGELVEVRVNAADAFNVMPTFVWTFVGTTVGIEVCNPAPLLPVEVRLLSPLPTQGLETLRLGVLQLITRDPMLEHRVRGLLLTAHKNDFAPALADVLSVPPAILGETICKRRRLFDLDADVRKLSFALTAARHELRAMGLSQTYQQLIETRTLSASPQQRVDAACATLLFASIMLLQPPTQAVTTILLDTTQVAKPLPPPSFSVLPAVVDVPQMLAPLLPVELRLLKPFNQTGLETLRRALLEATSRETQMDRRARAVLLIAHLNDFRPVFADVLPVPAATLNESIGRRRRLFEMNADVRLLEAALQQAQRELGALGLSRSYLDLIASRVSSNSPQHRVSAACAILLFGAMLAEATQ